MTFHEVKFFLLRVASSEIKSHLMLIRETEFVTVGA